MGRTRTDTGWSRLDWYNLPSGSYKSTDQTILSIDTCKDDVGPGVNHNLDITHEYRSGCQVDWAGVLRMVGDLPIIRLQTLPPLAQISAWADTITGQRIAASTAPTKPAVWTLTDIIEFRDIPHLYKHAGDLLHGLKSAGPLFLTRAKTVASTTLAYQFGWQPLIQDLLTIADFGKRVDQRIRNLTKVNSGQVLHRRIQCGSLAGYWFGNKSIYSAAGCYITAPARMKWASKAWATINWTLVPGSPLLGHIPTWWEAFNSLYGITPGEIPIQVWKGLPWTWLIDWFANFSNAMEVAKNLLNYRLSDMCLMHSIDALTFYDKINPSPSQYFAGGSYFYNRKIRRVLGPSSASGLHIGIPFIESYKSSVLSSLGVLKLLH